MIVNKRMLYHTHLKTLAYENLLSKDIIEQIPKSTLYRWMKQNPGRYENFDLNLQAANEYQTIRHFAHNTSAKRVYASYVRLSKFILSIVHLLPGFHREIKSQSKQVVELINRAKKSIGLKRVLNFFNISLQTFRNWSAQSQTQCLESLNNSCYRVFHNQLSRHEVLKIKEMVTEPKFRYWPISSIALYALRNNILPLSLNTWYKYVNKLGLSRVKPTSRRKKSKVSVRAARPHQIWHADITVFVTSNQVKHYIYVVIDNFSRKILSWLVANQVNAELRRNTIKEATKNVKTSHPEITLITDGGPENKLQNFLDSLDKTVTHKYALVDVHYSNSLIEAAFKTAKYNYLYRMDIKDCKALEKSFSFVVDDFNNRPHISLGGLTPNEAEKNITLNKDQLHLYKQKATEERLKYNNAHRCSHCKA